MICARSVRNCPAMFCTKKVQHSSLCLMLEKIMRIFQEKLIFLKKVRILYKGNIEIVLLGHTKDRTYF